MSTPQSPSIRPRSPRVASIDVFRGLTMLVMLFVNDIGDNDLGFIQNVPWWLKHMAPDVNGMTFVDVVFPAFLFIVGLSIPLALDRRLARSPSRRKAAGHIVARAMGLVFIGIGMVNGCYGTGVAEAAMGISGATWRLLFFSGVVLFWCGYPSAQGGRKWLFASLRLLGAAVLLYAFFIFRGGDNDNVVWMLPRWWGILGLIGWAYLVAAIVGLGCRCQAAALMGVFSLLLAVNVGGRSDALDFLHYDAQGYLPSLEMLATYSSMVVAGMIVAALFREDAADATPGSRMRWMFAFAVGCATAGFLLQPFGGIHKAGGTPAWILFSVAIACVLYAALYWIIDVCERTRGTAIIGQAGRNTLLMYMLPYIFYSLLSVLGIEFLQTHFREGWLGVARSAMIALCFVSATAALSRSGFRLKL